MFTDVGTLGQYIIAADGEKIYLLDGSLNDEKSSIGVEAYAICPISNFMETVDGEKQSKSLIASISKKLRDLVIVEKSSGEDMEKRGKISIIEDNKSVYPFSVCASSQYQIACVGTQKGVHIYDISDPDNIFELGMVTPPRDKSNNNIVLPISAYSIDIKNGAVFVGDFLNHKVHIFRIASSTGMWIKTEGSQFPNDYYPSLGNMKVVVNAQNSDGTAIDEGVIEATVLSQNYNGPVEILPQSAVVSNGKAEFYISGANTYPTDINHKITIRFSFKPDGDKIFPADITQSWEIRNNSNVTFGEVLDGKAVFVYDNNNPQIPVEYRAGITPDTLRQSSNESDDEQKKFDFMAELFNQIMPRKRSLDTSSNRYAFAEDDGLFSDNIEGKIARCKAEFDLGVSSVSDEIFKGVINDYDIPSADLANWENRVITKHFLVGAVERDWRTDYNATQGNGDRVVNTQSSGDTGLYELYTNVVKTFINAMITEGNRYAGLPGDYGDEPIPTKEWYSRLNYLYGDEHGPGMSYGYGCKDTIENFNSHVSNCRPDAIDSVRSAYRGDLSKPDCSIGAGTFDWPGLKQSELDSHSGQYNSVYWAGIDCSGFVQRCVDKAFDKFYTAKIIVNIPSLNGEHPDLRTQAQVGSQGFYGNGWVLNFDATSDKKFARKGDLIHFPSGHYHIGIVYSEASFPTDYRYFMIHAFGGNDDEEYKYIRNSELGIMKNDTVYARKVIVTPDMYDLIQGFGRIKLWN